MKKIAWVTTQRSELNASRYVIKAIADDPEFELSLIAGWVPKGEIDIPTYYIRCYDAKNPQTACFSLSHVLQDVSGALMEIKPDMLILNGDRVELVPIVLAATVHSIPIAHIDGGQISQGSIDNLTRYAISRYAHLHLVGDEQSAKNLIQTGEESWRIHVVGQCGLENVIRTPKLSLEETSEAIGLDLSIPTALCIYYPSIEPGISVEEQIDCILEALNETKQQTVFVYPCEELGSDVIRSTIDDYCRAHNNCKAFVNLENTLFQSVLWYCRFMIGNSSAGMIEAPFLNKWTINVGSRQKGRFSANTVAECCDYNVRIIKNEIEFYNTHLPKHYTTQIEFPSQKIVQIIKENINNPNLLYKKILLGGRSC